MNAPVIAYRELYRLAIAQTQRNSDRETLENLEDRMVQAGVDYVINMTSHGPYSVTPTQLTDGEDELVRELYDKRMRSKLGTCRWAYDQILASASHCPYCEDGEIYEIDHFLPQGSYHDLNIFPRNLVPICHACNHIKLAEKPQGPQTSLLHPYFDRLPPVPWLFARLDRQSDGPVLNYWVELDASAYGNLAPRLGYHFRTLELDRRMRTRSAKVLVELQFDIEDHLEKLGPQGMKTHFESEARKRFDRHGNVLEAAAYKAASENDAFCKGDYRN
jgi:hypothetical protein